MKLTASQFKQLNEAFVDAFDHGSLKRLVRFGLDENLDAIAGGSNFRDVVFNLTQWAKARGRLRELIDAAEDENPGNQVLRSFIESLSEASTTDSYIQPQWQNLPQISNLPKALILTALPVEFNAVRSFLAQQREETDEKGTVYCRGIFKGAEQFWDIIVAETGAGNNETALEAERAINKYDPIAIFFVGVAGGIKDVEIGDVVVATKIYGYESGSAKEVFQPLPDFGETSYLLNHRARAEARSNDWLKRLEPLISKSVKRPRVLVGPIAAGEKVIKSTKCEIYKFLQSNYGDALAVEMESRGILKAARANFIHALIVRGISDLLDKKEDAGAGGSQELAAMHASAFTFEILAKLQPMIQVIGSGLNKIDEFRELTFKAFNKPHRTPSVKATQVGISTLQIEERGIVRETITEQNLKLNEWDDVRYKALEKRTKAHWKRYNELYAEIPNQKPTKRIQAQHEMEAIKSDLCRDFREMIEIYERTLGVYLDDHYKLYEICGMQN